MYGNLLRSIQSAIDFFDLLASLEERRMDGTAVGCRYFGLGDDRPYFHPRTPPYPFPHSCSLCVFVNTHTYTRICIGMSRICELSDWFYVRSNDRLFEPIGNSLTVAFHRRDLSLFHFCSLSFFFLPLLPFSLLSRKFLESQRGGEKSRYRRVRLR